CCACTSFSYEPILTNLEVQQRHVFAFIVKRFHVFVRRFSDDVLPFPTVSYEEILLRGLLLNGLLKAWSQKERYF
ncbi:hypothetical protein ACO1C4_22615, partial [Bacillus cereus]|uniref:hypothetical protein n=1 Tax=Bacillus cereus TaxID=1396 RepID=UPI003BF72078